MIVIKTLFRVLCILKINRIWYYINIKTNIHIICFIKTYSHNLQYSLAAKCEHFVNFLKIRVTFYIFRHLYLKGFKGVIIVKKGETTDRIAISIRGLWHIESLEEKKKLIRHYDNSYRLFLLVKNHPGFFTPEELEKCKQKRSKLNKIKKDLISEIFLSLHMGIINDPLEYTAEETKALYSNGLYFTKEELEEMIDWQIYSKKHNSELIALLEECLDNFLYFNTVEEAEKVWDENETSHHNKKQNKPNVIFQTIYPKRFL